MWVISTLMLSNQYGKDWTHFDIKPRFCLKGKYCKKGKQIFSASGLGA